MARFLIAVWPMYGHVFPNVPTAMALRARGHDVAFYTGGKAVDLVEGQGFRCFPFTAVDGAYFESLLAEGYFGERSRLKRRRRQLFIYRHWLIGTLEGQIQDLEEIVTAWHPDVLIVDTTMWGPILVTAERHDIPVAIYSWTVGTILPGPQGPPPGLGLPPPRDWRTRLMGTFVEGALHLMTAPIRRDANAIRQRHGLPPLDITVAEYTGRMPLYIATTVPELDYHREDLPPSVRYVGPTVWSGPAPASAPAWMERLPDDRPIVYVSEGTLREQEPIILRAAAKGLANRPLHAVLTLGGRRDAASVGLERVAPNIEVRDWVPDTAFFPRIDAMVTAGGASTVLGALSAGVPLVVVPTEWDKPESAQRVVEAGAGLRLSPDRCTPTRLRQAVERVLGEPSFRANARRLAEAFAAHDGPEEAADLLEVLARSRMPA